MNSNNGSSSTGMHPRMMAPAGIVSYGGAPFPDLFPPVPTYPPVSPPLVIPTIPNVGAPAIPFDLSGMLTVCTECGKHHRSTEPCPWCMRSELSAIKMAMGDKAHSVEEIERLRAVLRKFLGVMSDIHKVTGSVRLAELIAEGDQVLGLGSKIGSGG